MKNSHLCTLLLSLVAAVSALYEDQVGELDWHNLQIGTPTAASYRGNYLIVGTTAGVVAALDASSGAIKWRNVLESGTAAFRSRLCVPSYIGSSFHGSR